MSLDSADPAPDSYAPLRESGASRTRGVAGAAGVISLAALVLAVVTLIDYAIQDHQTPGVVASTDRTVAISLAVASILAGAASIAGHHWHRDALGRTLAALGLIVAVCTALMLLLMWV